MEQLVRHKGRNAVILASSQGLHVKGSFIRTTMALPPGAAGAGPGDAGPGADAGAAAGPQGAMQEVALFLGAPKVESLAELQVRVAHVLSVSGH